MSGIEVYVRMTDENNESYKMLEVEYGQQRISKPRKFRVLKSDVENSLYLGKTYRIVGDPRKGLMTTLLIPYSIEDVTPKGTMVSEEEQYEIDKNHLSSSKVW